MKWQWQRPSSLRGARPPAPDLIFSNVFKNAHVTNSRRNLLDCARHPSHAARSLTLFAAPHRGRASPHITTMSLRSANAASCRALKASALRKPTAAPRRFASGGSKYNQPTGERSWTDIGPFVCNADLLPLIRLLKATSSVKRWVHASYLYQV